MWNGIYTQPNLAQILMHKIGRNTKIVIISSNYIFVVICCCTTIDNWRTQWHHKLELWFLGSGGKDSPAGVERREREIKMIYISLLKIFFWNIVDLPCCDHLRCTAKWFNYTCICTNIYSFFYILFHCRLLQDVEYNSLCYTVGPCWLSVLYIVACIF